MVNGKTNVEKDGGAIGISAANSANFSIDHRRYYRPWVIDCMVHDVIRDTLRLLFDHPCFYL